jgi:hypothetical protein
MYGLEEEDEEEEEEEEEEEKKNGLRIRVPAQWNTRRAESSRPRVHRPKGEESMTDQRRLYL